MKCCCKPRTTPNQLTVPVASLSRGALGAYLNQHEEVMKIARAAFEHQSRVVFENVPAFGVRHAEELAGLDRLSELMLAAGLYAEQVLQP
ncbi:MAG: hypothetical protein M2R45_02434 [Verrucomicrobia subdivision 3 bacterium]|nr:hypothetical protein [Limisphaerales bacterium]MCS1416361.1 hypothetical protein [Limisphaerales bacterium]